MVWPDPRGGRWSPRSGAAARALCGLLVLGLVLGGCRSGSEPPDETSDADTPGLSAPPDDAPRDTEDRDTSTSTDDASDDPPDDGPDDQVDDPSAQADPAGDEPPPPPPGRDALIQRIQRLVDTAVLAADDATLVVLVTDEHGREIASHQADVPVLPASTMKVVTAAAVLTTVGPRARLTTRVDATAPIDGDGALRGDLLLVGGGDPALATEEYVRWIYPARPQTPLSSLADDLVAAGLVRLEGDVVGTAPGYVGPPRAEGWVDRYFSSLDARYASGLTVDAGLRTILTYPEPETDPDGGSGAAPANGSDSAAGSEDEGSDATQDGDDASTRDLGPPTVTVAHVEDPAAHAAAELVRLLEERDVEVVGGGRSGEVAGPVVGRLATVDSPSMDELLRFAVQRSDNQLTDGLFQTIGRIRTGEGSWLRGDRALRQVLERLGIDHRQAVFADGSGLSRDDRLTARLLVDLDRRMSDSRHARTWSSLMAVMGESGTLRERLAGTVAAGRFRGKTGSLRDVTALSGSVIGDDGTRYHLAVIANDAVGQGRGVTRQLMDELVLQLSAEVAGCEVRAAETGDTSPPVPRSLIVCA